MTGVLPAVAVGGLPVARSFPAPTLLAVAGVAAVVTLLLYVEHPRVTRRAVVALVPWMLVGAALSVLASTVDYPTTVRPAVSGVGAYVTTYALVGLVWFAGIQFARGTHAADRLPTHVGSMGLGAAAVVVGALLLRAGALSGTQLFWLAVTPIAAAAVAGIVLLLLGLWYPEAAAYTGMAGGVVVFGHTLAAIGTAVAVVSGGKHSTLSWAVMNLLATVDAGRLVGVDVRLLWAGGFVWTKLVLATVAIIALTAYTQRNPNRGNLALGLVAAVGVVGGATALLSLVVGV